MNKETYDRKLKLILSGFSGHFMNDTKWRKLFHLLSTENTGLIKIKIISIWNDNDSSLNELDLDQLRRYEETYNQNGINDVLIGGPLKFKEIRKIIIQTNQMIKLSSAIDNLGLFEKEENLNELVIFGYK